MVDARVDEVRVSAGMLSYVALGDPSGRTVVALSGLSDGLAPVTDDHARQALPQLPAQLRSLRFLVFSYRDRLGPVTTTEELATDVADAIEQVCEPPVAVTGHSMGGMVAQHLAATRPDLVERLVLSATTACAGPQLRAVTERWDRLVTAGRWRAFYRDAIDTSFTGSDRVRRRLLLRLGSAPEAEDRVERHLALSAACRGHDSTTVLGDILCPTLVLAGELDPVIPVPSSRALAEAIPDATFEIFPGVGHGFPEQLWRRYIDRLVSFVTAERTGS